MEKCLQNLFAVQKYLQCEMAHARSEHQKGDIVINCCCWCSCRDIRYQSFPFGIQTIHTVFHCNPFSHKRITHTLIFNKNIMQNIYPIFLLIFCSFIELLHVVHNTCGVTATIHSFSVSIYGGFSQITHYVFLCVICIQLSYQMNTKSTYQKFPQ